MSRHEWQQKRVLITVLAYPNPSAKYQEANCIAGIDIDARSWIRLWPVPYRDLPYCDRFHKYDVIQVRACKRRSDSRPESWRPDCASISTVARLSAAKGWQERKQVLLPLANASMCQILREQAETGKSLGMFKPKEVEDFVVEDAPAEWRTKQQAALGQLTFFSRKKKKLEKIPLVFRYRYSCSEPQCRGHDQTLIDWEVCQLYRNLRDKGNDLSQTKSKIRDKFLTTLCGNDKDTHFFVGNQWLNARGFLVLGVFWPPKAPSEESQQLTLPIPRP